MCREKFPVFDFLLRIAKVLVTNSLTTWYYVTTLWSFFALLGSLFEFLNCLSSAVDATPMLQEAKVCCNQSCQQFMNKMERYGKLARIKQAGSCCPLSTLNDPRRFQPCSIYCKFVYILASTVATVVLVLFGNSC